MGIGWTGLSQDFWTGFWTVPNFEPGTSVSVRPLFSVKEHVFVVPLDGDDRHAPLPLPHAALRVLVAKEGADHPLLRDAVRRHDLVLPLLHSLREGPS